MGRECGRKGHVSKEHYISDCGECLQSRMLQSDEDNKT